MYKASKVYLCSPLHYVDGIPIDNMHAVLERATKWLMRAWLKSENHAQPFYLDRSVNQTDRILMQQHPPSGFSQAPRFISEFRVMKLYYSLPLLIGFLPLVYFHHYAVLRYSHSLARQCTNTISVTTITFAKITTIQIRC